MQFSVVVCNYNSNDNDIEFTLNSVICQKGVDFEIIFSDDGSRVNPKRFVEEYFHRHNCLNYKIRIGEKNLGTVKALYEAVAIAEGDYIKPIGVGDAFLSEKSLSDMYRYMMNSNSRIAFSRLKFFKTKEGKPIEIKHRTIPVDIRCWEKQNYKRTAENIIVFNDQICGASIFYEKEYLMYLMDRLKNYVIYMEDLCQYLALLEGERIHYFPNVEVMYEIESGISTNHTESNLMRMLRDKNNFLDYLFQQYPGNRMVLRRKQLEIIDRKIKNKILKGIIKELVEPKWLYFKFLKSGG